jgi:hypothetical protein
MAHTITETPTFTPSITVPDGTDPPARAAAITLVAQGLGDRTQALKVVTDDAARKSAPNTFTQPNTFAAVTAASLTVSGTTTVNGNVTAADGTVNVAGGFAATGAIATDNQLILTGGTHDVAYASGAQPGRVINIPLCDGRLISANGSYDDLFDTWGVTTGAGAAIIRFPVRGVPRGAPSLSIFAVWRAHDVSAANSATLYMNAQAAWASSGGALVDPTDPTILITVNQTVGFSTTQCTFSAGFIPALHTVNNGAEAFYVDVTLPDGPHNRLFALAVFFTDPGARNG